MRKIQDLQHQQTRVVFIWWLSRRAIDYWLQWGHSYWWSWWEELKILKISVYLLTLLTEPAVGSWLWGSNSVNRSGFPGCIQPLLSPPSMLSGSNQFKESPHKNNKKKNLANASWTLLFELSELVLLWLRWTKFVHSMLPLGPFELHGKWNIPCCSPVVCLLTILCTSYVLICVVTKGFLMESQMTGCKL